MGYHPKRPEVAAGGFTFIEVVLVLLVLGVVAALAVPTIGRSVDTIRARADVAGFSAVMRHAREQAITTQRPHAVVVEPGEHRLVILIDEKEVKSSRTLSPRVSIEANPPPALTVRFEPHGVSSGGEFHLRSNGLAYRIAIDSLTGRVRAERE